MNKSTDASRSPLRDEDGELVKPSHFIPAAENYNLMPRLDRWVIRRIFAKHAICFEITETAAISDLSRVVRNMARDAVDICTVQAVNQVAKSIGNFDVGGA